jgi:uncharacterized protein DUF1501
MNHQRSWNRRQFLQAAAAAATLPLALSAEQKPKATARADAVIFIWLPGGIAQADTWDPKQFTPYVKGMRGDQLLGTCPSIPTAADGIHIGKGLENIASVMDRATLVRSLKNDTKFGAIHLKAQYQMMTGYLFPAGVKAPSMGSVVSRTMGRRHPHVPAYVYIGRDVDSSDDEKLFISEYIGPGFYGINHAPFMIPDPASGLATLQATAGMQRERFDRRQAYARSLGDLAPPELRASSSAEEFRKMLDDARAMMDSPVKKAFDFRKEESPKVLQAYQPEIKQADLIDKSYYHGQRFGEGLLLARRLVEAGARFVQVEYQYGPFMGFDMHDNGRQRMIEMKRQIDRPIARLIRDLDERGLLRRTLVIVATEFGRTIASAPSAGREAEGFAEEHKGDKLILEREEMYGFHGHFSSCNCMLFFGGGFKPGFVHGKTAPMHPMIAVENPVNIIDLHATIYRALGIPPDTAYDTEGRPFYVTKDAKGQPIPALLV